MSRKLTFGTAFLMLLSAARLAVAQESPDAPDVAPPKQSVPEQAPAPKEAVPPENAVLTDPQPPPSTPEAEDVSEATSAPPVAAPPPTQASVPAPTTEPAPSPPLGPATPPAPALSPFDQGTVEANAEPRVVPQKSPWRNSLLLLDQSVTTQTVGIGQDYQSDNPTYDWLLRLAPRYYFFEDGDFSSHVRAVLGLTQEVTAGDGVTHERELDAPDSQLAVRTSKTLAKGEGFQSLLDVGLPEFVFPTSRASVNNGTVMSAGLGVYPTQIGPLQGSGAAFMQEFMVRGTLRYRHNFARSKEPVSDSIAEPRTDINGRPTVSDQLGSSALTEHEVRLGARFLFQVTSAVTWITDMEWRPTWKYQFDRDAQVSVLTGPADVDSVDSPQRFLVTTVFATAIDVQLMDEFSLGVGYENVANQIGPDGRRRGFLYSPGARFVLSAAAYLDPIFSGSSSDSRMARKTGTGPQAF